MSVLYWSGYHLVKLITRGALRIQVHGRERIPVSGGFILAPNHRSYYDPPIVGAWTRRKVHFMAKRELMSSPFWRWFYGQLYVIPVRRGSVDRTAQDMVLRTLQSGEPVTVFPEGTRSRTDEFLPPKAGIGLIAHQAACPVVPAYLHGTNQIGAVFKGRERLIVAYGEPISTEWIRSLPAKRESYLEIARAIMDRISTLRDEVFGVAHAKK